MNAPRPQDLPALFLAALNSGDAEAVVALYEHDGIIAPHPDQVVAGHAAIRAMAAGFLRDKPRFALHEAEVVRAGDVALARCRWSVTPSGVGSEQTVMNVSTTLVLRRQPGGNWLVVIDRPVAGSQVADRQVAEGGNRQ